MGSPPATSRAAPTEEGRALPSDARFALGLAALAAALPVAALPLGPLLDALVGESVVNGDRLAAIAGGYLLVGASLWRWLPRGRFAGLLGPALANALVWIPLLAVVLALVPFLREDVLAVAPYLAGVSLALTLLAWLVWNAWGPGRRPPRRVTR